MDLLYDPMYRATGDPFWDRRTEADLPSRQRLFALRGELAALRRREARARGPWSRRALRRLGDALIALGERLRGGAPHPRPLSR